MEPPLWKIVWQRTRLRLRRWVRRTRGRRFRRFMGVITIVKAFNPLIFLLAVSLMFYLLIIEPVRMVQSNLNVVRTQFNEAETALRDELDKVKGTLEVIKSILDPLRVVTQGLVDAYNALCGNDACKIDFPDLQIGIDLTPFNTAVSELRGAIQNIQEQISGLFNFTLLSPGKRAAVTGILASLALWILLSGFASVYTKVLQGVDMFQSGQTTTVSTHDARPTGLGKPIFETPPILIVDHALIHISEVSEQSAGSESRRQQQIRRRPRVLLSAQAVWPGRHLDLYHYELADEASTATWSRFWENLISRGLDASKVQLVISPDTSTLSQVTEQFLPNAKLQASVETTIVSG